MNHFEIKNSLLKKYREDFRHVTVLDGVTEIGRNAFFGSEFYTLTIPEGVKKIGAYAFRQCEQMEKIHLPSTVTEIHSVAFPAISTGVFGYPKEQASHIAVTAVAQWLREHPSYPMRVVFVSPDYVNYSYLLQELQALI